jgi:hypothetical protein
MSRPVHHVGHVDLLPMLGGALAFLWVRLADVSMRGRYARAVLTVTGYLRPRPARVVENALRAAFAELDKDLAVLLGDRAPRPDSHR